MVMGPWHTGPDPRTEVLEQLWRLSRETLGGVPLQVKQLAGEAGYKEDNMKTWTKPAVREQEVGLEVTSYLPAEIDII